MTSSRDVSVTEHSAHAYRRRCGAVRIVLGRDYERPPEAMRPIESAGLARSGFIAGSVVLSYLGDVDTSPQEVSQR